MKATDHGDVIIIRDNKGRALERVYKDPNPKETLRTVVRRMTNNLHDMAAVLVDIAKGVPVRYQLEDGQQSEPIFPSFETRRAAAKDVIEMVNGKAVAQTEVAKAEVAALQSEQLAAMTEDQLRAIIDADDVRVREQLPEPSESEANDER